MVAMRDSTLFLRNLYDVEKGVSLCLKRKEKALNFKPQEGSI